MIEEVSGSGLCALLEKLDEFVAKDTDGPVSLCWKKPRCGTQYRKFERDASRQPSSVALDLRYAAIEAAASEIGRLCHFRVIMGQASLLFGLEIRSDSTCQVYLDAAA